MKDIQDIAGRDKQREKAIDAYFERMASGLPFWERQELRKLWEAGFYDGVKIARKEAKK